MPANLSPSVFTLSVKDIGAKGDGVTDDTANINSAIATALTNGMAVLFPAGTYIVSSTINLSSNLTLFGWNQTGAIIKAKNGTNYQDVFYGTGLTGVRISDLTIDANQAGRASVLAGSNRAVGIELVSCTDCIVERATIQNTLGISTPLSGVALSFSSCTRCRALSCNFLNCGTSGLPSDGIYCKGSRNLISGCVGETVWDTAFVLEDSNESQILGCRCNGCAANAAITCVSNSDCYDNAIIGLSANGWNASNTGGIQIGCLAALGTGTLRNTLVADVTMYQGTSSVGPAIAVRQVGTPITTGLRLSNISINGGPIQGINLVATDVEINNCSITNTNSSCLNIQAGSSDVRVNGGRFLNNGISQVASITATSSNDVVIQGALTGGIDSSHTVPQGIYFAGTATRNAALGCRFKDSTISNIRVGHDPGNTPNVMWDASNTIGGLYLGPDTTYSLYQQPTYGALLMDSPLWVKGGLKSSIATMGNIQSVQLDGWTELLTIAASSTTDTATTIPAGALVLGVSIYVVTAIPTAATFNVGEGAQVTSPNATRWFSGLSTAQGTSSGTSGLVTAASVGNPIIYGTATRVRITPNVTPATATGQVRVTVHYITTNPATS